MSLPNASSQDPPPYTSSVSPGERYGGGGNPGDHGQPSPPLAPWQRRWNVEWLNEAMIPHLKYKFLESQRSRNIGKGHTRESLSRWEDDISGRIAAGIEAGFVSKENALKRTRLHRAIRRCTWPFQILVHDVKAVKKLWDEFKNKDKMWRVTAVMEEQGENPRWQAEMTFTIQPKQYIQMAKAGQWIEFPSPEDIKWLIVTGPNGWKWLNATDQRHWGPNPNFPATTMPFGERNGRIVRHAESPMFLNNAHLFVEQQRCNRCGNTG